MAPRIWRGAVSDWYMGVRTDRPPTPRPATHLPNATWYHLSLDAIWITTPTQNIRFQQMMHTFLPKRSAMGAEQSAPNIVPMDKRPTIVPDTASVKPYVSGESPTLWNRRRKSGISRNLDVESAILPHHSFVFLFEIHPMLTHPLI